MKITNSQKEQVQILHLNGKLDAFTSQQLEEQIEKLLGEEEYQLLIDCTALNYISSSGLRVFLYTAKQINQKRGKLTLCSMSASVKSVFDLTGFTEIFYIFSDMESALKAHSS